MATVACLDLGRKWWRALAGPAEGEQASWARFALPAALFAAPASGQAASGAPARWRQGLAAFGLEAPARVFVAAGEARPEEEIAFWRAFLDAGGELQALGSLAAKGGPLWERLPRPAREAAREFGALALPRAAAALLGLMSCPEAARRSLREGVIALLARKRRLDAFLIYRGRLFGAYAQPLAGPEDGDAALADRARTATLLDELRLGWLPAEMVAPLGGAAVVMPLPPEAEGFRPAFAAGPDAPRWREWARVLESPLPGCADVCLWGLAGLAGA